MKLEVSGPRIQPDGPSGGLTSYFMASAFMPIGGPHPMLYFTSQITKKYSLVLRAKCKLCVFFVVYVVVEFHWCVLWCGRIPRPAVSASAEDHTDNLSPHLSLSLKSTLALPFTFFPFSLSFSCPLSHANVVFFTA